jgi:hypothetical protein
MSLSQRQLQPELLDELPAAAPEAMHSRADLRRINALMGNARCLARTARELLLPPPHTLVELACGDGSLVLQLLRLTKWRPKRLILLDQQPVVTTTTRPALAGYAECVEIVTADVFVWLAAERERVDLITTNLFLHHFTDERLAGLLQLIGDRTHSFIACEPRRSAFALFNSRLIGLIGCNHVTRHDAVVSVKAGFADGELGGLWPSDDGWTQIESAAGLFSHRFGAKRAVARSA